MNVSPLFTFKSARNDVPPASSVDFQSSVSVRLPRMLRSASPLPMGHTSLGMPSAGPGVMSSMKPVPPIVPSVDHSSSPCPAEMFWKSVRDSNVWNLGLEYVDAHSAIVPFADPSAVQTNGDPFESPIRNTRV